MARTKNKATQDMLDELHRLTTEQLIEILSKGILVISKETGEPVLDENGNFMRQPPAPAFFTAAITFLKNNNVELAPNSGEAGVIRQLINESPFPVPDEVSLEDRPGRGRH